MRRMLRILFWLGVGLSTILFLGTGVLWVRSLGHQERWVLLRFEPRRQWATPNGVERGLWRLRAAEVMHGRLWLESETAAPVLEFEPETLHVREPIRADGAKQDFDYSFQPGERPWKGGTERAWRFAGVGFWHGRDAVDPQTGRPEVEAFHLTLPFWLLTVVFGLWPACFIAGRALFRRRHGAGLCPSCGYDLRATPDRCPECGRVMTGA